MALPGDALSVDTIPSPIVGARALAVTATVDYEDGGRALNDPSAGLLVQRWRARLIDGAVVLDAPGVEPLVLFSGEGVTEISFTFDQNMRPALAFMQEGSAKLRWYDSEAQTQVTTSLGAGVITPRVILDDKRPSENQRSDIILAYIRGGALYYRQQRDRFQIERLLDAGPHVGLIKICMGRNLRLQFLMEVRR